MTKNQNTEIDNDDVMEISWYFRFHRFFSSDWSVAGMKYVLMSGAAIFRRLIWTFLVLLGFGFMSYQCYDRVDHYLSHPTNEKIKIHYNNSLDFPTVTICSENLVDAVQAKAIPGLTKMILETTPPVQDPTVVPNHTFYQEVMDNVKSLNMTWDTVWKNLSPAYQQNMVSFCNVNNQICQDEDFSVVPTTMGYCLQFNGNGKFKTTFPGATSGLYLLLMLHQKNYLMVRGRGAGFRVLVHQKNEFPYVFELGFRLKAGHVTSAGVKLKTVRELPSPFGNCNDTSGYLYFNCLFDCYNNLQLNICGCRMPVYRAFSDDKACDLLTEHVCASKVPRHFNSSKCDCLQSCVDNSYQTRLSSATMSEFAKGFAASVQCKLSHKGKNGEKICNNQTVVDSIKNVLVTDYTELEVYFDKLTHEEVVSVPAYGLLALLCDIGGALGLILGSTILTFFEVLDFGLVSLYDFLKLDEKKSLNETSGKQVNKVGVIR